jgi:hypothetical protein
MMRRAFITSMLLLTGGCFENTVTEFPPGLEPFEELNEATAPEGTADDPYPEQIVFLRKRWGAGIESVHARSYVHADVATTFASVRNPLAGADRRESVDFSWEDNVEPDYQYSHRSHLVIPDIVTVEFWLNWRSGVVEGTSDAPEITATRWQKTEGSSAISTLEGSIVCREVEPGVTMVEWQYHLDAVYETIEDYLTGYYVSVLALAHGEELPVQE